MHGDGCIDGSLAPRGGNYGKALSAAQLPDHDSPTPRRSQGQASDIEIYAKEILALRSRLNEILAKHSGRPIEQIDRDTDRNNFMSAHEAKEYGIVDEVIDKRP